MKLLSDNPIHEKNNDDFHFSPFVDILGEAVLGAQSLPFTVGVLACRGGGRVGRQVSLLSHRGCVTHQPLPPVQGLFYHAEKAKTLLRKAVQLSA